MQPQDTTRVTSTDPILLGTQRLLSRLMIDSVPNPPDFDDLYAEVYEHFSYRDFKHALSMLEDASESNWQLIQLGDASHELGHTYEPWFYARSPIQALGFVLSCADIFHLPIKRVDNWLTDGLEFYDHNDELIIRYASASFTSVSDELYFRTRNLLKGLTKYGTDLRAIQHLKQLSGLNNMRMPNDERRSLMRQTPKGPVVDPTPRNWSHQMQDMLHDHFEIDIPLNRAQEMAAVLFGASNWHHLCANKDKRICRANPFSVRMITGNRVQDEQIWSCRDVVDAVAVMNQQLKPFTGCVIYYYSGGIDGPFHLNTEEISLLPSEKEPTKNEPRFDLHGGNTYDAELEVAEPYIDEARRILSERVSLPQAIEVILGISQTQYDRIATANRRRGILPSSELWIKNWLFTLDPERDAEGFPYLRGEQFNSDGWRQQHFIIPLYKSEFDMIYTDRKNPHTGSLWLVTNYKNEQVLLMDEFTHDEQIKISRFIQRPLPGETYAESDKRLV